jgi:cytochrome c oxidase cbb3-type subunit 2
MLGDPYTDADFASIKDSVTGQTEMDALIAYLQGLGVTPQAPDSPKAAGAAP